MVPCTIFPVLGTLTSVGASVATIIMFPPAIATDQILGVDLKRVLVIIQIQAYAKGQQLHTPLNVPLFSASWALFGGISGTLKGRSQGCC